MKGNGMDKKTQQISNPDRSAPGITTTAHSTAGLQGGCDKFATGANPSIKSSTKGTTMRVARSIN
ncbi:hypothetical protein DPMN_115503 [Dreissena polymorpha]|uniref:Uncharacterized protein n=1 Tax=Dreissena polymorpha TaxID=45954 RepID=A0A9D4KLA9_DREPO|nr:hypothetical protein DPMN_115503 [Dreissena polymorpha]